MIYAAANELEGKIKGIDKVSFYISLGPLLRGIKDDSLDIDYESRRQYMIIISIMVVALVFLTLLLLIWMRINLRKDCKDVDHGNTTPSDYTLWVQGID